MQQGPQPLSSTQLDDDEIFDDPTIQAVSTQIEQAQNQQAKAPRTPLTDEQRAKKRAYDRERQKKCFNKRLKTIANSLVESEVGIKVYETFASDVASQVEAKDQAYRKFMGMVAKVQAFAKASENNNYYIQTCLSSMPCNLSAAQRQELINRVNTAPLTPAFTNQQPTASLNGAMSGHGDKGEQAEKTVAPKLK